MTHQNPPRIDHTIINYSYSRNNRDFDGDMFLRHEHPEGESEKVWKQRLAVKKGKGK